MGAIIIPIWLRQIVRVEATIKIWIIHHRAFPNNFDPPLLGEDWDNFDTLYMKYYHLPRQI